MKTVYFTAGDLSRRLQGNVTPDGVRAAARRGWITASAVTDGGVQLFNHAAINRLKRHRERRNSGGSCRQVAD